MPPPDAADSEVLAFAEHLLECISSGEHDKAEEEGAARAAVAGSGEKSDGTLCPEPAYHPELKFLELVFSTELGSGAFSTVRKAQVVDPSTRRA